MWSTQTKAANPHNKKQVQMMLGALAVMLFAFANAPQAQAQTTTDSGPQTTKTRERNNNFTTTVDDPCTGEAVVINGRDDSEIEIQDTPGDFRTRFRDHQWGTGQGFTKDAFGQPLNATGAEYQYQSMTDTRSRSNTNTFSFRNEFRQHVVRKGPPPPGIVKDNFFIRIRVRVDFVNGEPVTRVEGTSAEGECK